MSRIILQCVAEGSKLRIRFHSYKNDEGKIFTNVYDNTFNCQFPRAIRAEGRYYEIGDSDLVLVGGEGGKSPFYRVSKNNIRVLTREEGTRVEEEIRSGVSVDSPPVPIVQNKKSRKTTKSTKASTTEDVAQPCAPVAPANLKIFEVVECVICMEGVSSVIFVPCGHRCVCPGCYKGLERANNKCPLCRRTVLKTFVN